MSKLYVVRGIGACWGSEVMVSEDFDVTMLEDLEHSATGCWKPGPGENFCYTGFENLTGIELEPGEYTTITVEGS